MKYTILIFLISFSAIILPVNSPKKALITGITGQDGKYLTELLLNLDYEVYGIVRRSSSPNTQRLDHLQHDLHEQQLKRLHLVYGDVTDSSNIFRLIREIQPDEVYNLAAQSHVKVSFEEPEYTANADALGALKILEAIRIINPKIKYYQASTSELYGKVQEIPQRETTPFYPRSPYAAAKLYAYWITKNYREAYGIFACNGILFNHESPVRGEIFVTRKITRAIARIKYGLQDILYLGNLDAQRDWGHAQDYVYAMWLMLQQEQPDDFVIATGQAHSVREFVNLAFKHVGITIVWEGKDVHEVGRDAKTGNILVKVDPEYFRPAEVDYLLGDATKAKKILGWQPVIDFEQLVNIMVTSDINNVQQALQKLNT